MRVRRRQLWSFGVVLANVLFASVASAELNGLVEPQVVPPLPLVADICSGVEEVKPLARGWLSMFDRSTLESMYRNQRFGYSLKDARSLSKQLEIVCAFLLKEVISDREARDKQLLLVQQLQLSATREKTLSERVRVLEAQSREQAVALADLRRSTGGCTQIRESIRPASLGLEALQFGQLSPGVVVAPEPSPPVLFVWTTPRCRNCPAYLAELNAFLDTVQGKVSTPAFDVCLLIKGPLYDDNFNELDDARAVAVAREYSAAQSRKAGAGVVSFFDRRANLYRQVFGRDGGVPAAAILDAYDVSRVQYRSIGKFPSRDKEALNALGF